MAQRELDGAVAERVSDRITESGVAVVWLCGKTGIPRSTLTRRLSGHSSFTLNELQRIADALRVPVAELLEPVTAVPA